MRIALFGLAAPSQRSRRAPNGLDMFAWVMCLTRPSRITVHCNSAVHIQDHTEGTSRLYVLHGHRTRAMHIDTSHAPLHASADVARKPAHPGRTRR